MRTPELALYSSFHLAQAKGDSYLIACLPGSDGLFRCELQNHFDFVEVRYMLATDKYCLSHYHQHLLSVGGQSAEKGHIRPN